MKRIIFRVFSILILYLLLVSCSSIKRNSIISSENSNENKDKGPNIKVQSPITLSNNDLFHINGKQQYLRLKMVKGKYYEDWSPGAHMGTIWEGYYIIELADNFGNTISQIDLSKIYKEPLVFNFSFQILFDDYNNDSDMDFTIGQFSSSNGRDYKLFTLRKNGKIEELSIKNYSSLFISNTTGYYSIKLKKIDKITFKKEYYDNSKQKHFEDIFKWDKNKFIKIESHVVNDK